MDYRGSLDYLYGLQRFGIKLGLDNIRVLLDGLGNPQQDFPVVHVGGTNGKGSVSAALAAILREGGYRVGLYTSPHLLSFTERIRVDAETISEVDVACLTDELRSHVREIPATFFEFTTALALCYFHRRKVDIAILEVGMGGRLDATNIVEPCLTVLTPVSIDHAEHLGNDLSLIAAEKAGIIKPGVPVVSARQPREALDVLRNRSARLNAPLEVCGEGFRSETGDDGFNFIGFGKHITNLQTSLVGVHQVDNMALAVAASQILAARGFECTDEAVRKGLTQVDWPGRLEWWQGNRSILLDGAHNIASMQALAAYLETLEPPVRLRWVVGFKGDKDYRALLAEIVPFAQKVYVCEPPSETAVERSEIVACVRASGLSAQDFASVEDALKEALREKHTGEIVLVAGSLFLVAAVRKWLLALKGSSV